MTAAESLALIKASAPYTAAGNIETAWLRFRASNPGEAAKLLEHLDALVRGQTPAPPVLVTKFGRGVLGLLPIAAPPPLPEPAPVPPSVTPSFWDQHFAIVITAGNIDPALIWDAGVRAVAFDLTVDANFGEMRTSGWSRFQRGGFTVVRATTEVGVKADAGIAAAHLTQEPLAFLVCDQENLKADPPNQDRFALQSVYYAELRRLVSSEAKVANITYGWHQDGSVVNYGALKLHGVEPWFEAYNGDEASWDTRAVTEKLNGFGFKPARISLGDKRLAAQVPVWKQLVAEGKAAKGAMLWAVDNGPAQDALRAGAKLA